MKKGKSLSWFKKKADEVFSEYIRRRDKGICFTCGNQKRWQDQDCGHYISRQYNELRYDERNANCQCKHCNVFRWGNLDEYAIKLIRKYGIRILEEFWKRKHFKGKIFKTIDLEEIIKTYKRRIKDLEE